MLIIVCFILGFTLGCLIKLLKMYEEER